MPTPVSDMATIDVPYVQRFKDRHGRVRHYYRRPGYLRVPLPPPGEPGFLAAYEAAGERETEGAGSERTVHGTLSALIVAYYQSASFAALRDSTKKAHRGQLDNFRKVFGAYKVAIVTPAMLESVFHGMAKAPAQASNLRKRLRVVFKLAVRLGWRADNPVTATEPPRYRSEGFTPWTDADVAAFEKRWPTGSRERLALALLLYTGQRRSDVVKMGRQHIRDGRIHLTQKKTLTPLAIPILPALQREIDAAPLGMTFMLTAYGKPFSEAGFTSWFVERAKMAGLIGLTPHGLRKAAGRRMAEAGGTTKQIASVLGHKSLSEAERYTRDADQTGLADAMMARREDGA